MNDKQLNQKHIFKMKINRNNKHRNLLLYFAFNKFLNLK